MSASLRSPKPVGTRRPVPGTGRMRALEPPLPSLSRRTRSDSGGPDGRMVRAALTGVPSGWATVPESGMAVCVGQPRRAPGRPGRQVGHALTGQRQGLRGVVPSWRDAQRVSRLGRRRGVAGLVAVCVLALGVAACSVRDAKAEASASASASASAAVARAEKGIAEANASATASREAALTPELRAKRDAALAEPAPAKTEQMNEDSPEGAASSVRYFLELYRYAYVTGKTDELAKMSEDQCKFCRSAIDNATSLHNAGGWNDKWEQEITNIRYYEKLEGYDFNRVEVTVSHQAITSHPGGGAAAETSSPTENEVLDFAIHYVDGRWLIGGVRVEQK